MKPLILILLIITFGLHQPKTNDAGLEIYRVNKSYSDLIEEYNSECLYCLDIKKEDLFDKPILTEDDFEKFDWVNQQIELTEKAKKQLKELKIPLKGLPVAMVLNGEIVYGFWFWNIVSSFGCDRVYTYPTLDFKIRFGLPQSNTFGNDPRFDERLENYLTNKK